MNDPDVWSVKAALDWTAQYLAQKHDENPRLSAEWLVGHACELSRIELYVNYDRPLTKEERAALRDYVIRRAAGEPLQYITGEVGFRHITVKVKPGVLIPRPETEVLVSTALSLVPEPTHGWEEALLASEAALEAQLREEASEGGAADSANAEQDSPETSAAVLGVSEDEGKTAATDIAFAAEEDGALPSTQEEGAADASNTAPASLRVVDLCTGSGCIACSLAYEHPQMQVIATDISPVAVSLAQENAARLGLNGRVAVLCCDLADKIPDRLMGTFDLVISNPPYIPSAVLSTLSSEVRDFEPTLALDGGEDGNDFVRRILPWTLKALKAGGAFALELHETCLDAARDYALSLGFVDVVITKDLTGAPRVLSGQKQ